MYQQHTKVNKAFGSSSITVEHLAQDLEPLLSVHYVIVNRERNFRPRLLDLDAFSKVADLLTHYCLNLVIAE
jgi:hypothetical protein